MTKRIIIIVFLTLTCSVTLMSQESKYTLMPKAGMTVSTLAGEDAEYCSNAIGWTAGVDLGRRLIQKPERGLYIRDGKKYVVR